MLSKGPIDDCINNYFCNETNKYLEHMDWKANYDKGIIIFNNEPIYVSTLNNNNKYIFYKCEINLNNDNLAKENYFFIKCSFKGSYYSKDIQNSSSITRLLFILGLKNIHHANLYFYDDNKKFNRELFKLIKKDVKNVYNEILNCK